MKKIFSSGKVWTVLSALLFFMACGMFVTYAVTSSNNNAYSRWKIEGIGGKLHSGDWNDLMDALDKNILVPDATVMAFYTDECPDGWDFFTGSVGRFLLGDNSHGGVGGSGKINIGIENLPEHSHYVAIPGSTSYNDNFLSDDTDHYLSMVATRKDAQNEGNSHYNLKGQKKVPTVGLTSSVGSGKAIDIINPYITVVYCIKGSYDYITPSIPVTIGTQEEHMGLGSSVSSGLVVVDQGSAISTNYDKISIGSVKNIRAYSSSQWGSFDKWDYSECGDKIMTSCNINAIFKTKETVTFSINRDDFDPVDCSSNNAIACAETQCGLMAEHAPGNYNCTITGEDGNEFICTCTKHW